MTCSSHLLIRVSTFSRLFESVPFFSMLECFDLFEMSYFFLGSEAFFCNSGTEANEAAIKSLGATSKCQCGINCRGNCSTLSLGVTFSSPLLSGLHGNITSPEVSPAANSLPLRHLTWTFSQRFNKAPRSICKIYLGMLSMGAPWVHWHLLGRQSWERVKSMLCKVAGP